MDAEPGHTDEIRSAGAGITIVTPMPLHIHVPVEHDHLESLARQSEPGWGRRADLNALDAEADTVEVTLTQNELGGVQSVSVIDNRHSMTATDAENEFEHRRAVERAYGGYGWEPMQ